MIRDIVQLMRPRVSLAVGAGTLFGTLYHGLKDPWHIGAAVVGSFLLCGGCSALNQIH